MTDDLEDLKQALKAATPAPDAGRRAENIALAQKNFENLQGSPDAARPKSDRPVSGLWTGVSLMFKSLTSRAGLTATTAIVAVGFVAILPITRDQFRPGVTTASKPETIERAVSKTKPDVSSPSLSQRLQEPAEMAAVKETEADDFAAAVTTSEPAAPVVSPAPTPKAARESARKRSGDSLGAVAEQGIPEGDYASMAEPETMYELDLSKSMSAPSAGSFHGGVVQSEPAPQIAQPNTEEYANEAPNPVKITKEDPVSTFSIDVDTASYSVVRNSLMNGYLPPADAVRVEELVNYFPYSYTAPTNGQAFQPSVSVVQTPWDENTQLVHIGLQGTMPEVEDRPPLNLVFLIDTSGSMNAPNKLPLLKQSFRLMVNQLRPEDEVSIVTYAGSAGQVLAPTPASKKQTILAALDRLGAGGSTAGQEGLQQAYATAAGMTKDGEVSRIILATDGDFNVGLSDPEALKDYIADKRETGTYLSVLGFGRGNLDDATMQALAQNGNGQAAFIDTLSEAQKVLVDQLSGALFPIANDVKIQIEFNPAQVSEYRLIGYETRALRREDFNNDKVDAGDIGAGHQVTAIYEITPKGSKSQLNDPLRYGDDPTANVEVTETATSNEIGFLRLRYKKPGESTSNLIEKPITPGLGESTDTGFAVAIAGFGQMLRSDDYLGDWSLQDAITLANENKGDDPFGYRAEAIKLMRLAASLSGK